MTKRIVLCADDYGQAEAVSKGILELVALGRLTAVSCLTNQAGWQEQAASLVPYKDKADIGLHLNFTDGMPLSAAYQNQVGMGFMPLSRLLFTTMTRSSALPLAIVIAEINAQLDAFQLVFGMPPRFIDGHQHIQHLPIIRDALLSVYRDRLLSYGTYLRAVTQPWQLSDFRSMNIKKAVINATGGAGFAKLLDLHSIPHNTSFTGIYAFADVRRYRQYFQTFLRESQDRGLIMCHPGLASNNVADPIYRSRGIEYEYFKSADFTEDCARAEVVLTRFATA